MLYPSPMDPKLFVDRSMGRVIKTPGRFGFHTYVPARVPRRITLDEQTVMSLSEADSALGRLAGAGRLLPNPHILVRPYQIREAVASSRIEGTQASISDVFDASAVGEDPSEPIKEVQNYVSAMNQGLARLTSLPISLSEAMSWKILLGTDYFGRDMLSRILARRALHRRHRAGCRAVVRRHRPVALVLAASAIGGLFDAALSRLLDALTPSRARCWRWSSWRLSARRSRADPDLGHHLSAGLLPHRRSIAVNVATMDYVTVARARGEGSFLHRCGKSCRT